MAGALATSLSSLAPAPRLAGRRARGGAGLRSPLSPEELLPGAPQPAVLRCGPRDARLSLSASAAPASDPSEGASSERDGGFHASIRVPASMVEIGRQLGGKGGGSALLEKSGLDLGQSSASFEAKTDDTGGGGSNGGKVNNGGGGGDGDEGDDDDYFEEGDEEGDDGAFSMRQVLPELFDRASIECVLKEWYRTIGDLPAGLRLAVEMGIVSSLQLARFLSVDCRPTVVRAVSRVLPSGNARAFVGRLMADPSFVMKLGVEQVITLASGIAYEAQQRGSKLGKEADLAAVNVAGLLALNAAVVWSLAPTRSYGEPMKYAWQRVLHGLPNYVFDTSGPLRQYSKFSRAGGFVYKAAQLSAVGVGVGAATCLVSQALVNHRRKTDPEFQPAVPVPALTTAALGTGAWLGLTANFRYQLIGGMDLWMRQRLSSLSTAVAGTSFVRLANNYVGDMTRLHLLGLPLAPPPTAGMAAAALGGAVGLGAMQQQPRKVKRRVKRRTAAAAQQAAGGAPPTGSFSVSAASASAAPRREL